MSNRIRSAAVAVVAAVLIGVASGETRTPVTYVRIAGRVVDVAGEPIFASVRLVSEDASATTWTEKDGSFICRAASPNTYDLIIEAEGFKSVVRRVRVDGGSELKDEPIVMDVGPARFQDPVEPSRDDAVTGRYGSAQSEEFCALTLDVKTPDGTPTGNTWVELRDDAGNVELRKQMKGSELRICDFGFGKHSLVVGTNEAFPVTVSNILLRLGYPITLTVVLNAPQSGPLSSSCRVYFRIASSRGGPVAGAKVQREHSSYVGVADEYGRVETFLPTGHEGDYVVTRDGFKPGTAHLGCTGLTEIDSSITLDPADAQ